MAREVGDNPKQDTYAGGRPEGVWSGPTNGRTGERVLREVARASVKCHVGCESQAVSEGWTDLWDARGIREASKEGLTLEHHLHT